jgi:hypothetical protein
LDEDEPNVSNNKVKSFEQRWGWYSTIVYLAQEDINKIEEIVEKPLTYVLNYLTYMKDLNAERNKKIKILTR